MGDLGQQGRTEIPRVERATWVDKPQVMEAKVDGVTSGYELGRGGDGNSPDIQVVADTRPKHGTHRDYGLLVLVTIPGSQ